MGESRAVVLRGLTFGVRAGAIPAGACAVLWGTIEAARLAGGPGGSTLEDPALAALAVLGSLAAGVLVGAVTGLALACLPLSWVSSGPLRTLICFVLGGTLSFAEVAVMAVSSKGGYGPMLLALFAMPVVGAVTAARSREIAAARLGAAVRGLDR
ncbi:hypothetical protein QOM21_36290 [Streptomyces sp. Pv4-95]|uniref:hypothetical protein n=1 Tax=Streptomyces sp. Pv4-95 TaxID=3049543 RepID=UPI0038919CB4